MKAPSAGVCYLFVVVPASPRFTYWEYIELEEISGVKHEFLDGLVWAMAGGSPDHAAIAANIGALLSVQLRDRPCRVFSSDLRISVQETGLSTYPGVAVVCGRLELDPRDHKQHTVVNPSLVVEVLSSSTEEYDRGKKLAHYKRIPSLDTILLVAQEEQRVEAWQRDGDHWTLSVVHNDGMLSLPALECQLPLGEIYRNPLPR